MSTQLEHLARLYEFESWRRAPMQDENLFVWLFRFFGGELPGWKAHRVQHVEAENAPPAQISVWLPNRKDEESMLAIDVYEAPSRDAAREYMLRRLGEFQGPRLERRDGPGEIAFASGGGSLLFVRANLVVLARSVERRPAPLSEIAARFDNYIAQRPAPRGPGAPEFSVSPPTGRGALTIEVAEPERQLVWFKLFSRSGEFRLDEQHKPAFVPVDAGPHEITIFGIGAAGGTSEQRLRLA